MSPNFMCGTDLRRSPLVVVRMRMMLRIDATVSQQAAYYDIIVRNGKQFMHQIKNPSPQKLLAKGVRFPDPLRTFKSVREPD